jgi:hypothetical protein
MMTILGHEMRQRVVVSLGPGEVRREARQEHEEDSGGDTESGLVFHVHDGEAKTVFCGGEFLQWLRFAL